MAKCKRCKINIPEGTEFCDDCRNIVNPQADESYLDGLLNSVINSTPTVDIYKKKSEQSNHIDSSSMETVGEDMWDTDIYKVDLNDLEDFDKLMREEDFRAEDIHIEEEELFGSDLKDIFSDDNAELNNDEQVAEEQNLSESDDMEEIAVDTDIYELLGMATEEEAASKEETSGEDIDAASVQVDSGELAEFSENESDDDLTELINNLDYSFDDAEAEADSTGSASSASVTQEPESNKDAALNTAEVDYNKELELFLEGGLQIAREEDLEELKAEEEGLEQMGAEDDDFMSLLSQISADDPVANDVIAINDLLQGKPVAQEERLPGDVGEVFSDALKGVSILSDPEIEELDKASSVKEASKSKEKKVKVKKAKEKKADKEQAAGEDKPKQSIWQRLFANIEDDEEEKAPKPTGIAGTETADKGKKKRKKKKATVNAEAEEDLGNVRGRGPGDEEVVDKKLAKKEKKAKKKKTKEIIQVIDEIDDDKGRINRLGASIVFAFFGLIMLLVLTGSKVFSYTISINNATKYFERQKYTQAYDEISGIDIKDEDLEIYEKIQTVMFVNKQLNSYNNYYSIKKYPEALDSLLKGLKRYDKYIELATLLGIKSDLDYVRGQILAELDRVFNLSEEEALAMNNLDSMYEYSLQIYDVVLENMSY